MNSVFSMGRQLCACFCKFVFEICSHSAVGVAWAWCSVELVVIPSMLGSYAV